MIEESSQNMYSGCNTSVLSTGLIKIADSSLLG
jgi:hypothetical protein